MKNVSLDLRWKCFPGNNFNSIIQVKKELATHICSFRNYKGL
jgi:hypothetical protein